MCNNGVTKACFDDVVTAFNYKTNAHKLKYLHQWFWPGLSGSFVVWILYDGWMNDQKIMISPNSPLMVPSLSLSIYNIHYFTAAETTLTLNGRSSFCFHQWGLWIGSNWPITSLETVGSNIPTSHVSEWGRVTEDGQLRCIVKDSLVIFQFSLHGLIQILKNSISENHFTDFFSSFLN